MDLKSKQVLTKFEAFLHQHYGGILSISPMDSLTPAPIQNRITGKEEFIFLAKLTPYVYKPVKNRDIMKPTQISLTMYFEGEDLIVGFSLLDMKLETFIPKDSIKNFLTILKDQEYITLAILDATTYKLIWFTNTISFRMVRFHYEEIFKMYNV